MRQQLRKWSKNLSCRGSAVRRKRGACAVFLLCVCRLGGGFDRLLVTGAKQKVGRCNCVYTGQKTREEKKGGRRGVL